MIKTLLKKMQGTYTQSKKQARRIPGGEYLLQVQKCKLEEKDQQVKGVVEYYVLEGEEEGCVQREQYQITERDLSSLFVSLKTWDMRPLTIVLMLRKYSPPFRKSAL